MIEIDRIEAAAIPGSVQGAFEALAAVVGADLFYRTLSRELHAQVPVDRLYVIEGSARSSPLIAETEPDKPAVTGSAYVSRFLPADPLRRAIDLARDGGIVRLKVTPADITVPAYRAMLERADVIERVSFVRQHGRGWRCMNVARRRSSGAFDAAELDWLGGYFRLFTPLIDRHRTLVGEVVEDRAVRLAELEERFTQRFPELTPRERQVCARAAIGVSIEGAALDLGIGSASVLTYRKRAYQRLGVTSAFELAQLVMR